MALARDILERSILGGILIRPDVLALVPNLETDDFAGWKAKAVWAAYRSMEAEGTPIDQTTLAAELERAGKLDSVGEEFLALCALEVPIAQNVVEYAAQLRDMALVTRIAQVASTITEEAKRLGGADLLAVAYEHLAKLSVDEPDRARTIGEVVRSRWAELEEIAARRARGESAMTGYPTGSAELDAKISGWQPSILQLVAARPGMGKSSMGLATANAATAAGHGVHYFSLEDGDAAMADRALARDSDIAATKIRSADFSRDEMGRLARSAAALWKRKNWLFDSRSGLTVDEIVRSVRRRRREIDTRVVIVDYAQKIRPPRQERGSRQHLDENAVLTQIVEALADAATQDGIAYVLMSQLNRDVEKRVDKRPQMSDMRGSGSLEQCAKIIVGLYRGAYYGTKPVKEIDWVCDCPRGYDSCEHTPSVDEWERTIQLCVIKQNQGPTGVIYARWDGPTTRIS